MSTKEKIQPTQSLGVGEVSQYLSNPPNDAEAKRLLTEAQKNLELAAESGYTPELRRGFSTLALLGVGFGITNSWAGVSAALITGIQSGGPILIVYGIVLIAVISTGVAISLSELTSAYPSAAGQYYWTQKLAPPKYAGFASYMCGAFGWAGAVFTSAAVTISMSTMVVGIYALMHPEFEVKTWNVFVAYQLINAGLVVFNIWEKPLPKISQISLFVSLMSFTVITIVVLAKSSGDFQPAHFVFVDFENETGWLSAGMAFIVGLINPNWAFSCLDAATHLAEETLTPETDIPKAIIGTVIIGFITSLVHSISMFFSIKNLDEIYASTTGVPILDIFYQVLKSKAGAIVLQMLILLTAFGCNISSHTWQARLCWSFARDEGLPGSRYWSKVNKKTGVPVNAHLMSCAWCAVIGCIYLASTTAYNAVVIGCIIFLLLSYSVPIIFLLLKGRNNIRHGPFWMGKIGYVANWVLLLWTVFTTTFYSFPAVMPVTAGNMNYVSVVIAVYGLYCVIYWFARGRKRFRTLEIRAKQIALLTTQLSNQIDHLEVILSRTEEQKLRV